MLSKQYKRVIQLELNEVSNPIIQHLIDEGKMPNFKKLEHSFSYLQTRSEEEYEKIEPWIQWVTAHTGKSHAEHQIFNLGDAHKLKHKQIWEVLSQSNIESGIIGSMNAMRNDTKGGIFFPDPWSIHGDVFPASLKPLWTLISNRVQSHATSKIGVSDIFKGLQSSLKFNVPMSIYFKIANQIVSQKLNPKVKWKLAILFDLFQAELFKNILKRSQFGYYTLFLNAIAHYQHHYWRNYSRSGFNPEIKYDDIRESDDPISYGYEIYDKIVGDIINQVGQDEDTLIIIASGLSQIPYTDKEEQGGMNYYRLKNHKEFAESLGLRENGQFQVFPLMSRDWQIKYDSESSKQTLLTTIGGLKINQEKLFNTREDVDGFVFIETAYTKSVGNDDAIIDQNGKVLNKFNDVFTNIAIKSGHHTGIGNLWLSDNQLSNYEAGKLIELTDLFDLTKQALGV